MNQGTPKAKRAQRETDIKFHAREAARFARAGNEALKKFHLARAEELKKDRKNDA